MIDSRQRGEPAPQTPTEALDALRAEWRAAGPAARREILPIARAVEAVRDVLGSADGGLTSSTATV